MDNSINNNNSTIISWNCRGIKNKKGFLERLTWNHKLLVIALQELKLKPHQTFNTNLSNYSYIDERLETQGIAHGGVGFYIHKDVTHTRIPIKNTPFQAIAILAYLHKRVTICNIYIHPQQNFTQADLKKLTDQLPKPFILTGDFNSHNSLWHDYKTDTRGETLENFILDNDLNILDEDEHTFEQIRTDNSIYKSHIDLTLITPDLQPDLDWTTCDDDNGGSDHFPIKIDINKSFNFNTLTKWNFSKADWNKYRELAVLDKPFEDFPDAQSIADYIVKTLHSAGEKAIGTFTIGPDKIPKPWWNSACKKAVANKKEMFQKFKREQNTTNRIAFNKANAISVKTIRKSKQHYWNKFLESINSFTTAKDVWSKIQTIKGKNKNKTISGLKIGENKIADQKKDIANELGKHYQNISNGKNSSENFKKYRQGKDKQIDFESNPNQRISEFNLSIKTSELKHILETSRDTAPGEDGIPYIMIRQLSQNSQKYLLEFYNYIFLKDTFPEKWKQAVIIPILKPGKDATETSSYRPISLISCLSKILEKILNKRLMWYLEKNNLLDKTQCGYREGRSAPDHLVRLTSDIQQAFISNKYHISIFLDLEKAYDTCWKQIILDQLVKFKINGHLANYIQNFLDKRSITVKVGNNFSDKYLLDLGVPQGSSISCTLFIIAVNTITKFIPPEFQKSLFVDDCRISITTDKLDEDIRIKLQTMLHNLETWASQTGFKFAKGKSELLICNRKIPAQKQSINLTLDGKRIKSVSEKKFLGLWFDHRLLWKTHVTHLKNECSKSLNLLKTLAFSKTKTDTKMLLRIYKSLILPKIDYGCHAYGTASDGVLKKLNVIHNQALRLCLGAFHTTPIISLEVESNLQSLEYRRKILGIKYLARTQTIDRDKTICNLRDQRQVDLYKNSKRYKSVAAKIGSNILELDINFPKNITKQNIPKLAPWIKPPINFCFHMEEFPKKDISTTEIKAQFLRHQHQTDIDIYTDGSKTKNERVGSGLAILYEADKPKNIFTTKATKLSNKATILTAELEAIKIGLQLFFGFRDKTIAIYSDSKGALQSIMQYDPKHPTVKEIQGQISRLYAYNTKIIFCWVPSHCGIAGNEHADKQANLASKKILPPATEAALPVVAKDLNSHIAEQGKLWLQNKWDQDSFDENGIENKLHFIDQKIGERKFHIFDTRLDEIKYNRIRLGHTRLTNSYLSGTNEPPLCDFCNEQLTIRHIFSNCPLHAEARKRFFEPYHLNFIKILSRDSHENPQKVLQFLKYSEINGINIYSQV